MVTFNILTCSMKLFKWLFTHLCIYVYLLLETKEIPQFQWIFFNPIKEFQVSNQTGLIWNVKF